MSKYNSNLQTNTASLQQLLNIVNNLPEASNGVELPSLTNEGSATDLLAGKELIDGEGNIVTGNFTIDEELATQETLLSDQHAKLAELAEILSSKVSATPVLQSKTVTPSYSQQYISADSGYDGLLGVTVAGDTNLTPENIVVGKSIFGVEGNANANTFPYKITIKTSGLECTPEIFYGSESLIIMTNVNRGGAYARTWSCTDSNVSIFDFYNYTLGDWAKISNISTDIEITISWTAGQ